MVVFGFLCDTTCRRHRPRTQFDMSARVMSSGQTQVSLGERWLIWGAGRQRNSQDNPSVLLHQLVPTWGWKQHTLSINEWGQTVSVSYNQSIGEIFVVPLGCTRLWYSTMSSGWCKSIASFVTPPPVRRLALKIAPLSVSVQNTFSC